MKFEVDKHLFPFKSNFTRLDDGNMIHYVDEGKGPILLMLHGNPTWSFLYRKMIHNLRDQYRCIAPDYPGFGLSEAIDDYDFHPKSHSLVIEQFINKLGLKGFVIIVQDWGGPIGLGFAGRNSSLVKGAIIGNTWAWPLAKTLRFEVFSRLMGGAIGVGSANWFNGVWKVFMTVGFEKQLSNDELRMYKAPFKRRSDRYQTAFFAKQLIKAREYEREVEKGLANIDQIPVLFTWGMNDFAFKEKELKRFQDIFPNHKTLQLSAGHFWQDDRGFEASIGIKKWFHQNF